MSITVCIVDDHPGIRNALEHLILCADGFDLAGSCSGFREAVIRIPALRPQVVLMDINLGENENGIDIIRELKPNYPELLFMMCTVYEEDEKIFDALNAGASGYILKKTHPDRLLEAIRELKEGGAPMSSLIARKVINVFRYTTCAQGIWPGSFSGKARPLSVLSNRENEILEQLSLGLLYKEIAANLFISQETVRKHVYHIYEKLHVNNRVEAINKFFRR
ncbi:MAG TPA: response regulator transcription factor [Puia sp.]